ncbi:MAG: LysM peptidoglycan-binding domain-containing protein [Planctomycetota bacterium]|jgi:hypothetical protein
MMEPGVRIAAAFSVLLAGLVVALMFRHDVPAAGTGSPGNRERLVLGERPQPPQFDGQSTGQGRSELPFSASASAGAAGQKVTVLRPTDPDRSFGGSGRYPTDGRPPELAKDYPGSAPPGTSGWGRSIELPSAPRRVPPLRTHKIVDGDTLEALASAYLGSADRWLEIYELNRDVLPSPALLPIGVQLKIPPLGRQAAQ